MSARTAGGRRPAGLLAGTLLLAAAALPALAHEEPAGAPPPAPAPVAAAIPAPAAATRAGHYYLQGVMETGSELLLAADGTFQWYFTYGALDLAARGQWREEGGSVVLATQEFLAPDGYDAMKFERLLLRVDGAELIPAWPWDGGAERGRYSRD